LFTYKRGAQALADRYLANKLQLSPDFQNKLASDKSAGPVPTAPVAPEQLSLNLPDASARPDLTLQPPPGTAIPRPQLSYNQQQTLANNGGIMQGPVSPPVAQPQGMPTLAPPKTPAQEQGANFIETQKAKWATMQGYRAPTAETPAPMPTPAPAPMPTPAPAPMPTPAPAELAQKYASVKQAIEPKAEMPATPAGEKVVLGAKKPLTATAGRRAVAEAEAGAQETTVYYKTSAGVVREIVNAKITMKNNPDFAGTRATLYPGGRTVVKGTNTKTGETQTITVDKDGKYTIK
jgi:hypothetical protein